jgi:hypothetical protein
VSRLQELELLDEKCQNVVDHLKAYQQRMCRSYNHRVKPRTFQVGNLVLNENPRNQQDREHKGKFEPNWFGPFVVVSVFGSIAYQLSAPEGDLFKDPMNSIHLKKFYA